MSTLDAQDVSSRVPAGVPSSASADAAGTDLIAGAAILGKLSPELEILRICARLALDTDQRARLLRLLDGPVDVSRLLTLAGRHGLLPLLARHLEEVEHTRIDPGLRAELRAYTRNNLARTLRLTGTLLAVVRLLDQHGIQAVPYKGPILAATIYGHVGLRQAGDLDVLVRKEDVTRAVGLLQSLGFQFRYPTTPAIHAFRLASRYSEELVGPDQVHLELHWAFANRDVPFALSFDEVEQRLQKAPISGSGLRTFAPDDLLLILAVHGAKHRWDRLEWVVGVAETIRSSTALDWPDLLRQSARLRARRTLLLAVYLAHGLLDVALPEGVLREARRDRWIGRLARDAAERIFADPSEPGASKGNLLSRNLYQLPLQQTPVDRLRYLTYRLVTPNHPEGWRTVAVGRLWVPLHAITWPARLVAKLVMRPIRDGSKRTP